MTTPKSHPPASNALMGGAALVTVIAAGMAGMVAFAPSKDAADDSQSATTAEAPAYTDPKSNAGPAAAEATSTPTAPPQTDESGIPEATTRSQAEEQSKTRRCYQNLFPVNIIQKLNDDEFFAYSRFSVGSPMPVLLTFSGRKRPTSSGIAMLSPRDGLLIAGTESVEMESGFSRKATRLTIGDQRCARLWAVIERDLEAAQTRSKTTQETIPRRTTVPRGSVEAREAYDPPSELSPEEVTGMADVNQ